MINAGVIIKPFNGNQQYNLTNQVWEGVAIEINYPANQDSATNPPTVGDYIVESDGEVWLIENVAVDSLANNEFTLTVKGHYDQSGNTSLNFGNVVRGSILSPINGTLVPYWDATKVSTDISRIINIFNAENKNYVTQDASLLETGTVGVDLIPSLPISKIANLQNDLDAKATTTTTDQLNTAISDINALLTSNDTSLDELQEIVNFIKQNKNDLDSLGVANIAGLQSALDAKQESLVSGNNIKTLNGNPILGSGDIVITADVSRMDIEVTSFASLSYTGPTGVTVSKEYSNSSLRIIHGQGKKPSNWAVYNNEANPITQVVSSSTRNLQVVDDNTVIVTNVSEFEVMSIVLNF